MFRHITSYARRAKRHLRSSEVVTEVSRTDVVKMARSAEKAEYEVACCYMTLVEMGETFLTVKAAKKEAKKLYRALLATDDPNPDELELRREGFDLAKLQHKEAKANLREAAEAFADAEETADKCGAKFMRRGAAGMPIDFGGDASQIMASLAAIVKDFTPA